MIRSSHHSLKFANSGKRETLDSFLSEYQRVGQLMVDDIWENGYGEFNIKTDSLSLHKFLDYNTFNIETELSARAMSSLAAQVAGVISAVTEKRRRLLWCKGKLIEKGESVKGVDKALAKAKFSKPFFAKVAEISSKCAKIGESEKSFDLFLTLASMGKAYGKMELPIQKTRVFRKWEKRGKVMGSFLITTRYINIRFKCDKLEKVEGETVGGDQGQKTVLSLSNGQTTPDCDHHGHSCSSICEKIARKKKGSKAFARAARHRKNFLNWSLNQCDFSKIKQINLEKIHNINFGRRTNRKMQAWTNTAIRDKVKSLAQEQGVLVVEQDCAYRSQRCSVCGNVRKANRMGKLYSCRNCGNTMDADINAARNHAIELPDVRLFRGRKLNLKRGFFWNPEGMTDFDGRELGVPGSETKGIKTYRLS